MVDNEHLQMLNLLEDTFLLLDALEDDQPSLRSLRPRVCLEIG